MLVVTKYSKSVFAPTLVRLFPLYQPYLLCNVLVFSQDMASLGLLYLVPTISLIIVLKLRINSYIRINMCQKMFEDLPEDCSRAVLLPLSTRNGHLLVAAKTHHKYSQQQQQQ